MNSHNEKMYSKALSVSTKAQAKMMLRELVERRILLDPSVNVKEATVYELGHIAFHAHKAGSHVEETVKELYGVVFPYYPED